MTTPSNMEWPVEKVRSTFVKFFESQGHTFWPSSPCVLDDDPTLLFCNAGMNQFKEVFSGTKVSDLHRACNFQKCIRVSGKHNDLETVGTDTYHHTFFEMLGNWSFGDYFKEGAIDMAWKCLTEEFGLDPERLYATFFRGNEYCPPDMEARDLWLKYLPISRVLPFDAKDNFWEMGGTGPCGPCTEIHYDRIGGGRDASNLVNTESPNVIEIWNLVFVQYNRDSDGSLQPLDKMHIDTGMGLERLTSILQEVDSNYDTDIFQQLFERIRTITGAPPYGGDLDSLVDTAYRIVADHIRTLTFAIADGVIPSNVGRGYVLRKLLRRAVFYSSYLGAPIEFISKLVPTLVECMGKTFPELPENQEQVVQVLRDEELKFRKTLDKGQRKFKQLADKTKGSVFSGDNAHFLYTSMGFPQDLTKLLCQQRGMTLDMTIFEQNMVRERELSRDKSKM